MAEVSMKRHWGAKQLVVFFGAAGTGTGGGWGSDAVLRACCKVVCRPRGTDQRRGRMVLVDERRTSRVSSAVHGKQPCESHLNKRGDGTRYGGFSNASLVYKRSTLSKAVYYFMVRLQGLAMAGWQPYPLFIICLELVGQTAFLPYAILLLRSVYPIGSPGLPPRTDKEASTAAMGGMTPRTDQTAFDCRLHVRVLVPCYKEPMEVVVATIMAAVTVYLCDDGKDPEKKAFIEALSATEDVVYVSGRTRKKGEVNGKSANLNFCLHNIYASLPRSELNPEDVDWSEISNKELVVVFDSDMCAKPDFFCKASAGHLDYSPQRVIMEVMLDDNIALCLTPQAFHNIDPDTDLFNSINVQFWEYWLPGAFAWGYIACTGTNFCIRARALSHCGWFPEYTITEDYALGMELKSRGYKATYLNDYIAVGELPSVYLVMQAPEEIRNVFRQRSRWTKGHFQVFFSNKCPLLNFELPFFQRLWYSYAAWAPITTMLTVPAFIIVPFMSIAFGIHPVTITYELVLASTLYFVSQTSLQFYVHTLKHLKLMWFVNVSNTVLWFTFTKAFVNTMIAKMGFKAIMFKVTEKTKGDGSGAKPVTLPPAKDDGAGPVSGLRAASRALSRMSQQIVTAVYSSFTSRRGGPGQGKSNLGPREADEEQPAPRNGSRVGQWLARDGGSRQHRATSFMASVMDSPRRYASSIMSAASVRRAQHPNDDHMRRVPTEELFGRTLRQHADVDYESSAPSTPAYSPAGTSRGKVVKKSKASASKGMMRAGVALRQGLSARSTAEARPEPHYPTSATAADTQRNLLLRQAASNRSAVAAGAGPVPFRRPEASGHHTISYREALPMLACFAGVGGADDRTLTAPAAAACELVVVVEGSDCGMPTPPDAPHLPDSAPPVMLPTLPLPPAPAPRPSTVTAGGPVGESQCPPSPQVTLQVSPRTWDTHASDVNDLSLKAVAAAAIPTDPAPAALVSTPSKLQSGSLFKVASAANVLQEEHTMHMADRRGDRETTSPPRQPQGHPPPGTVVLPTLTASGHGAAGGAAGAAPHAAAPPPPPVMSSQATMYNYGHMGTLGNTQMVQASYADPAQHPVHLVPIRTTMALDHSLVQPRLPAPWEMDAWEGQLAKKVIKQMKEEGAAGTDWTMRFRGRRAGEGDKKPEESGLARFKKVVASFKPANVQDFGKMFDPLALLILWLLCIVISLVGMWELSRTISRDTVSTFALNSPLKGNPYLLIAILWSFYNSIAPYCFLHYCFSAGKTFKFVTKWLPGISAFVLLSSIALLWFLIPTEFNVQGALTMSLETFLPNQVMRDTNLGVMLVSGLAAAPLSLPALLRRGATDPLPLITPFSSGTQGRRHLLASLNNTDALAQAERYSTMYNNSEIVSIVNLLGGLTPGVDPVKYAQPSAYTLTMLAWSLLQFPQGFSKEQACAARKLIKLGADYLMRCNLNPKDASNPVFVAQLGDPNRYVTASDPGYYPAADGKVWTSVAQDPALTGDLARPAWVMTRENPGADLLSGVAAALSAASLVLAAEDAAWAGLALTHARYLYAFGTSQSLSPKSACASMPCTTEIVVQEQVTAVPLVSDYDGTPRCYWADWNAKTCRVAYTSAECDELRQTLSDVFTNKQGCCEVFVLAGTWSKFYTGAQGICALPEDQTTCYVPDRIQRTCYEQTVNLETGVGCSGVGIEVFPTTLGCCTYLNSLGVVSTSSAYGQGLCARVGVDLQFTKCYVPSVVNATCMELSGAACAQFGAETSFDQPIGCCNRLITMLSVVNTGPQSINATGVCTSGRFLVNRGPSSPPPPPSRPPPKQSPPPNSPPVLLTPDSATPTSLSPPAPAGGPGDY
ncbi:hypothetical protein V8C86DRAFT_3133901, partial [Haematococcus lacustris]